MTRRALPAALAAAARARDARAQEAGSERKELEAARETLRRHAAAMAKVALPLEAEPAFQFRP